MTILDDSPVRDRTDWTAAQAERFVRSAALTDGPVGTLADCRTWLEDRRDSNDFTVRQIALTELDRWRFASRTGDLEHESGRFFAIRGLRVTTELGLVPTWTQPIIHQPENGILGLLITEIDGIVHFLVQAKMEPGNPNLVEVSPTVQATRSNFTGVHHGRAIRHFEHFAGPARGRVITDVLQSEQGDSFFRKRNRNMVIEATQPIEPHPDFRWLTLGQLNALLSQDCAVNMDCRTVLSTLPALGSDAGQTTRHSTEALTSWLTGLKCHYELTATLIPLNDVEGWRRTDTGIEHEDESFFRVIGAAVTATNREVGSWTQPLLTPVNPGVAAFVIRRFHGEPHVLVHGKPQGGLFDFFEIAPSVQCVTRDLSGLPAAQWPPLLEYALNAPVTDVLFDTYQSEEGGRFYHRRNRYLILQPAEELPISEGKFHRWVGISQLNRLARINNCVNVEARTLLTCLQSL